MKEKEGLQGSNQSLTYSYVWQKYGYTWCGSFLVHIYVHGLRMIKHSAHTYKIIKNDAHDYKSEIIFFSTQVDMINYRHS